MNKEYLLSILSNNLATPLLSDIFTLSLIGKPNLPFLNPDIIKSGEELSIIKEDREMGLIRAIVILINNPNTHIELKLEVSKGYISKELISGNELQALGLTKVSEKIPYLMQNSNQSNPITGAPIWITNILFSPGLGTLFYNGLISLKIINDTDTECKIWYTRIERFIVKPKYISQLREIQNE